MAEVDCIEGSSRKIGYARVSSDGQDTAVQLEALRRAGVDLVFQEKRSGGNLDRPELERVLGMLRSGDVLVVYKVDRLARSLFDLLSIIRRLGGVRAGLQSLTEPIDTTSALGELVLQILGAIAQFELALIRERCRAGRAAATARGVVFGRRRLMDYAQALEMRSQGYSVQQIAEAFGVSPKVARSALNRLDRGLTTVGDPRASKPVTQAEVPA